jgi:alpha-N-arabinofuranosidase
MKKSNARLLSLLPILAVLGAAPGFAQDAAVPAITIKADQIKTKVSPTLYGLMTEEINYSYEGGLYGELIRNRTFRPMTGDTAHAGYWETIGMADATVDIGTGLNAALTTSLKLDATKASKTMPQGISNAGFWGVPVKANTAYKVSFYAKTAPGFAGPVAVAITAADGKTVIASAKIAKVTGGWKQYTATIKTGANVGAKDNRFTLTTTAPGTLWLQQVSLFQPTYKNRANGNRIDIMQLLADMKPAFLRLPGGNYLEGDTIPERFDWKKTIGDTAQRPGHNSPWKYWSTDGLGLLEYLEWCEDLNMQPVLAVYAGYSLHQDRVAPGPDMLPYVQDALDEIEYVTGDAKTTKWGAQRAKDGHPAPFPLKYVEIGNEDWFDNQNTYDARYTQFHDAIKAKYPDLQLISTITPDRPDAQKVHSRTPDLVDEHLYPNNEGAMESRAHEFDNLPRTGPKIFVGEWATRVGAPTPNMTAALADAAWMTGMERNSDLVVLESYAPLFTNVSHILDGRNIETSMQWPSDLIGYDAATSYGSPSYYAQVMFSQHHGDVVLASEEANFPTWTWQPPTPRPRAPQPAAGAAPGTPPPPAPPPPPPPPPQQLPSLYYDVTRDSASGKIFLKVVNRNATPQPVKIAITGVGSVARDGEAVVMKADAADATNTITDPKKVVPVTEKVSGLSTNFTRDFPAWSITVLELQAK